MEDLTQHQRDALHKELKLRSQLYGLKAQIQQSSISTRASFSREFGQKPESYLASQYSGIVKTLDEVAEMALTANITELYQKIGELMNEFRSDFTVIRERMIKAQEKIIKDSGLEYQEAKELDLTPDYIGQLSPDDAFAIGQITALQMTVSLIQSVTRV